jgi:hypothetical protein
VIEPEHFLSNHVKSIADPSKISRFITPHNPELHNPAVPLVDVLERPVTGPFISPPLWETSQVNHYYFLSRKEYYAKLRKSRTDNNELRTDAINEKVFAPDGHIEDTAVMRFAPGVKDVMRRFGASL